MNIWSKTISIPKKHKHVSEDWKTQMRMYSAKPKLISKEKATTNLYLNVPRSLFLPISINSFYIQTTSVNTLKTNNAKQENTADLTIWCHCI